MLPLQLVGSTEKLELTTNVTVFENSHTLARPGGHYPSVPR